MGWYAVRCIFEVGPGQPATFEERITLWRATGFDEAIALAEAEAHEYSTNLGMHYLDLAQCYAIAADLSDGAEVFSLMRDSDLAPDDYVAQFFDTGAERTR